MITLHFFRFFNYFNHSIVNHSIVDVCCYNKINKRFSLIENAVF